MATLRDERPPEDVGNEQEEQEVSQIAEEPEVQETPQEDDIPEKYQGKSTAEIVRMHQEAEKLLGRQSSEVGELRSVVDNYIQTQLDTTQQATQEPEEEIVPTKANSPFASFSKIEEPIEEEVEEEEEPVVKPPVTNLFK